MQYPRIHLNGSDGETLKLQYLKAQHAVHDAMVALQQIDLNGRDYYVGGPDVFSLASGEHQARWRALRTVHAELEEIAENIDTQISARKA